MSYRLTVAAENDLIRIYAEGAAIFGSDQAETYFREFTLLFALIANAPEIARERNEIYPPVRIHPHNAHLIVYRIEDDGSVLVIRIRHAHENWQDDPVA